MDGNESLRNERNVRSRAGRAVTMEDVGRLAGVSQVTVSRALSDPSKVSVKTLQKIQLAIEQTGFVPNAMAGALAGSRSRLVSVLVPSVSNIVYAAMITSFGKGLREHGYQILLSETGFDISEEETLVSKHLSRRPDAMMLTGVRHSALTRKMLLGAAIPIVEVWDMTDSPIDLCVGFSHVEAARAAARFAIGEGHSRAASISAGDERALRRQNAFAEVFERETDTSVSEVAFRGAASLGRGREGLSRLIDEQGFDGGMVFCSSDLLAHGVLIEARCRGIDVPGRIAVMGFGDQDFAEHTAPGLTTVRVDREALGLRAAEAILGRLGDAALPAAQTFDVGFEIVRRSST